MGKRKTLEGLPSERISRDRACLDLIHDAIIANDGIIYKACGQLKVSRSQFYFMYRHSDDFKAFVDECHKEAKEMVKDQVEEALLDEAINARNTTLLKTLSQTILKDRVYSEKQEIEVNGTHEIIVKFGE